MLGRLKAGLHPLVDPLLSLPDGWRSARSLHNCADGEYSVPVSVPYFPQFASPERIDAYIHEKYDGASDPRWHEFGAEDPADYVFWAPRVCALACLKMAIEAFRPNVRPSLWELVQQGLAVNGYTVRDEQGNWVDRGWTVHAQVHLASHYGLRVQGHAYASPLSICQAVRDEWLVAAAVTPELGEREPSGTRYGGHLVLVYGFRWAGGKPTHYLLHNPSGRFPELQAHAVIPARRFHDSFAHRFIALKKQ